MFQSWKNRRQSSEELTDVLLSAYLDGELPRGDRAALEVRLRQEQALVTRLEGLRQTQRALTNLPRVEVPRNFILAPSMVAPPQPAAAPRQRRTWPIFGWATAIATLLLLVVFAGDLFVYTPSTRPEPSDIVAEQPKFLGEAASENGVERPSAATDAAAGEGEAPAEAKTEEVVVAAEVPVEAAAQAEAAGQEPVATEVAEQEVILESEAAAEEMDEGEPAPPPTGGGGEAPTEGAEIPPEEALAPRGVETPSFQVMPAPSVALTTTVEGQEVVVTAPAPSEEVIADEAPQAAAPSAEEAGTESDRGTRVLRELSLEATPDALASAPETLPPAVTGVEQGADDATPWLRLAETGLGLTILALATVTLILRRREV